MKLDTLFTQGRPTFSLEIFPPKRSDKIDVLYRTLEGLADLKPDFISVTYGAGGGEAGNSTCSIASHIKNDLHIEPLVHTTCVNSTTQQVLANLRELEKHNIENVLALRGDLPEDGVLRGDFTHADQLAALIRANSDMNVVGACYPEGHYENKDLSTDIDNLHYKLDAGVTHLITQLFFDNDKFYRFMDQLRGKGITVPVEAGIMPIVTTRQIERTVALSGASLPTDFTHMVSRYSSNPEALYHAGIAYAIEQICELLDHGVQGIHVYTMNNAQVARAVYDGVKSALGR